MGAFGAVIVCVCVAGTILTVVNELVNRGMGHLEDDSAALRREAVAGPRLWRPLPALKGLFLLLLW